VRVAIYTRVSSEEQVRGHYSLDTQRAACTQALDRVYGPDLYVATVFSDEGYPGRYGLYDPSNPRKKYRPALTAMRDAFKAGELDASCVYRLNRLWRKAALADFLTEEFVPVGLQRLVSCWENVDLHTASGRFQLNVAAAVGAYETEQLGEWLSDAKQKRKRDGYPNGVPFGWRRQTEEEIQPGKRRGIAVVPEEAEIVRQLAERYDAGETLRSLTHWLNTMGVPTPRRGARWHPSGVRRVIGNCVHAGLVALTCKDGTTSYLQGQHCEQRIYGPELFHRIAARMARTQSQGPMRAGKAVYLLGGLITCGHCGHRLNGRLVRRRNARYYRCAIGSQQCNPECGRNAERADFVEDLVLQELRRLAARPELRLAAQANVEQMLAEEREEIKHEMNRLESRLQKLWAGYMFWSREREEGRCAPDEFDRHVADFRQGKGEVEARLAELKRLQAGEAQRRAVLARAQELVADFEASWEALPLAQRRELVQKVVESATMSRLPDGRTEMTFTLRGFEPVTRHLDRRSRADRPEHGPASLTDAQQASLHLYAREGLDRAGIAKRRGVRWATANTQLWQARTKLGVATLEEAWEIAGPYTEANLHRLPLDCRKRRAGAKPADGSPLLTQQQERVLCLLRQGATPSEIAAQLSISINTVYVHLQNCRDRLGAGSTDEAVRKAAELGHLDER